jgi:hypothetical protein
MKFKTLQRVAKQLGHTIADITEEDSDGKVYSINDGELEIQETNQKVKVKTIGGERETDRNLFALIGFKHYPATHWEPEDVADYEIGKYDGLVEAARQAFILIESNKIDNVFEAESLEECIMEEEW